MSCRFWQNIFNTGPRWYFKESRFEKIYTSVLSNRTPVKDAGPWGGGTLIFSAYVGSDPASALHPQKYQEFQAPPKISPILYFDLKKTLKYIEMTSKYSTIL